MTNLNVLDVSICCCRCYWPYGDYLTVAIMNDVSLPRRLFYVIRYWFGIQDRDFCPVDVRLDAILNNT
jgi:hypothetical protein